MAAVQTGEWMQAQASVKVEMGDIAWLDGKRGNFQVTGSAGAREDGVAHPTRPGIFTSNLSTCFAVAIIGRRGSIMLHVPGYLGHTQLHQEEWNVMMSMRNNFQQVWNNHFNTLINPPTVVLVRGSYTQEDDMNRAIGQVCPEILAYAPAQRQCEVAPNLMDSRHGKVLINVGYQRSTGNELYVEGVKVL